MSETKPEGSPKRRRFSEEFKQEAVRLLVVEKYSFEAAAKAVGVSGQTLRHWHARPAGQGPCRVGSGRRRLLPIEAVH